MGLIDLPQSKWGSGTGRQVILKGDFLKEQDAILQVAELMPPPIPEWVDATEIKVPATADCPAKIMMSGFPNILHPGMVGGGLTDGRYRENIADVTLDFDLSTSLWGTEKVSQWYLNYALAGNADEDFTLKAMPYMRVKSQASQVISLGTLVTPATGIGYGFTTNELVGGKIYVHTGASRGLVRTITANNNNNSTGGAITYGGSALTLAAGDWFAVLPPTTNFRLARTIFNNNSGNIVKFKSLGNKVVWLETIIVPSGDWNAVEEDINVACPLSTFMQTTHNGETIMAHPLSTISPGSPPSYGHGGVACANPVAGANYIGSTTESGLSFCTFRCYSSAGGGTTHWVECYGYPEGRGY